MARLIDQAKNNRASLPSLAMRCCKVGCIEPAAFRIEDPLDPNPETSTTDACEEHLGWLIGHAGDLELEPDADERWIIRYLKPPVVPIGGEKRA